LAAGGAAVGSRAPAAAGEEAERGGAAGAGAAAGGEAERIAAGGAAKHPHVEIHHDAVMQLLQARFSSIPKMKEEGIAFPEGEVKAQLKRCEYMMHLLYESVVEGESEVRDRCLEYGWERGEDQVLRWSR
jgi:hypothetical protein